jgi:hypothetical protein
MKIQKTIQRKKLQQFLSEHQEQDLDIKNKLSAWLENNSDYGFTVVELEFILDLFRTISECENMGKSIR